LFFSNCFYLILFKNIVDVEKMGNSSALPDRQLTMKILVLMDTSYTEESPTECSANYQIMMGMENFLLSPEVTLYSDSKIKLGLLNFPPSYQQSN